MKEENVKSASYITPFTKSALLFGAGYAALFLLACLVNMDVRTHVLTNQSYTFWKIFTIGALITGARLSAGIYFKRNLTALAMDIALFGTALAGHTSFWADTSLRDWVGLSAIAIAIFGCFKMKDSENPMTKKMREEYEKRKGTGRHD